MKKLMKKITVALLSLSLFFHSLSFAGLIDLLKSWGGGVSVCSDGGGDLTPIPYDDPTDCLN